MYPWNRDSDEVDQSEPLHSKEPKKKSQACTNIKWNRTYWEFGHPKVWAKHNFSLKPWTVFSFIACETEIEQKLKAKTWTVW